MELSVVKRRRSKMLNTGGTEEHRVNRDLEEIIRWLV
jgi:hypothetical protein